MSCLLGLSFNQPNCKSVGCNLKFDMISKAKEEIQNNEFISSAWSDLFLRQNPHLFGLGSLQKLNIGLQNDYWISDCTLRSLWHCWWSRCLLLSHRKSGSVSDSDGFEWDDFVLILKLLPVHYEKFRSPLVLLKNIDGFIEDKPPGNEIFYNLINTVTNQYSRDKI